MTSDVVPSVSLEVRNVLVPLDGSELALRAMPTALALAQRFDAAVHTISVVSADERADHLRGLASGALGVEAGDDHVLVVAGAEPAEAIANRARELTPSVVCLTSHGRGRLRGALVGSVARAVLQRSSDPMVVLGPVADNPGLSPRPRRFPEPLSVARIVACVDGSKASEQVLPLAAVWASALQMSLSIVTVIGDVPTLVEAGQTDPRYGGQLDAGSYVDELVEQWRSYVRDIDGEVLRDPIGPAGAIRLHLDRRPAGLVAVTTHARSGLERLRLGAVAASIVHDSIAPCLVAPVRPE